MTPTHLKSTRNNRVFLYIDILAKRSDMVPCDAKGEILQGHIGEANEREGKLVRKAPYLGNVKNGRLFPWSDILAARGDVVPVDDPAEWELRKKQMMRDGFVDAEILKTDEPTEDAEAAEPPPVVNLTRNAPAPEAAQEPAAASEPADEAPADGLPDITGLGNREAKTVLADWADERFGEKIDRRLALPDVLNECQALLENFGAEDTPPLAAGFE